MLPFSLKIVWFVLSATGLLSCWIVLLAFGRSIGVLWPTMAYCVGNTLLQTVFCLGMIYRMDPYQMPRSFCIVQTVSIALGAYLITGVGLAFSIATSMTVLKPKTWADGQRALVWRNLYAIPVILLPVLASVIHIIFVLKFDSVHPSDDLHCDSSHPEWVRFIGYAGLPLMMSLPSLYLSIQSIRRVRKTNRHLQRSRPESLDGFTSIPRKRDFSLPGLSIMPTNLKTLSTRKEPIGMPTIATPAQVPHKPHPRFKGPGVTSGEVGTGDEPDETRDSSHFSIPESRQDRDDTSSSASASFPTFTSNPSVVAVGAPRRSESGGERRHERPIELVRVEIPGMQQQGDCQDIDVGLAVPRTSDSIMDDSDREGEKEWDGNGDKVDRRSERSHGGKDGKDDFVVGDGEGYSARPMSMGFSAGGMPYRRPRRQPPSLNPAVWRIILFQLAFFNVLFLACISTFVDVVSKRPSPSPIGTQHVALLLAAWGPVIIFGCLPSVRRNLIPWRPAS